MTQRQIFFEISARVHFPPGPSTELSLHVSLVDYSRKKLSEVYQTLLIILVLGDSQRKNKRFFYFFCVWTPSYLLLTDTSLALWKLCLQIGSVYIRTFCNWSLITWEPHSSSEKTRRSESWESPDYQWRLSCERLLYSRGLVGSILDI